MNDATGLSRNQHSVITLAPNLRTGIAGIAVGAILYAIATAPAQAPQTPSVVKATRFVLVDGEGRERAVLGFNGQSAGLYIDPGVGETGAEPFISLDSTPIEESSKAENTRLTMRNGLTPTEAHVTPNSIGLRDRKKDDWLGLQYVNSPSLAFIDRSGFPYVWLRHDEVGGIQFEIRSPLGIGGAFDREAKAMSRGEKGDPRIDEALHRSLRFRATAPPFADPMITLWKDGRVIWNAKGE